LINEIDAVASTHIATLAPRSSIKSLPSKRSANSPLLAHNLKRSHLPPSLSSKFQARLESNLVGGHVLPRNTSRRPSDTKRR